MRDRSCRLYANPKCERGRSRLAPSFTLRVGVCESPGCYRSPNRTSPRDRQVAQQVTRFAMRHDPSGRNGLNGFDFGVGIGRNYVSDRRCRGRSCFASRREEPSSLESRIVLATPSLIRVPTMLTSRLTRTVIASVCLATLLSGCCVTSMKIRKHRSCPCESQPGSDYAPIQQGIHGEYEPTPPSPPSPLPPSPAPASAAKARDFGTKTVAMFRSAGSKVAGSFDGLN